MTLTPENISNSLGLALDAFLLAKEGEGVSPRTLDTYRRALLRFMRWSAAQGITQLSDIAPAHVRAYFADLHKHGYTTHTIHDYARPVKTLLRFWHADGLLPVDVMAHVKMPAIEKRILPALTEAQVRQILSACEIPRDTAIILLLLDTGIRASECVALNVTDFDQVTGSVQVEHAKGGKRRTVYTGVKTRRAIIRYLLERDDPTGPLFVNVWTGNRLTNTGILQIVSKIGDRAGVHCSPHTFRRSFALMALRNGMDIRRLAALMGHSSLQMMRVYLDVAEHDLQAAHREHGPVDSMLKGGKR